MSDMDKLDPEEVRESTRYTIFRTGAARKRHYQINKMIMGVSVDEYWVQLDGRDSVFCSCMGFRRQSFPKMEHKHVKLAQDYHRRGEPIGAEYTIKGTGASAEVKYLGAKP